LWGGYHKRTPPKPPPTPQQQLDSLSLMMPMVNEWTELLCFVWQNEEVLETVRQGFPQMAGECKRVEALLEGSILGQAKKTVLDGLKDDGKLSEIGMQFLSAARLLARQKRVPVPVPTEADAAYQLRRIERLFQKENLVPAPRGLGGMVPERVARTALELSARYQADPGLEFAEGWTREYEIETGPPYDEVKMKFKLTLPFSWQRVYHHGSVQERVFEGGDWSNVLVITVARVPAARGGTVTPKQLDEFLASPQAAKMMEEKAKVVEGKDGYL